MLRLGVLSLAFPILQGLDGMGFADWDFVLDKFEAMRRTILIWGQFPWWNPWSRGGFPLAAEPQIGAVSIATPLVLTLGTSIGLRISAIFCLLIAVEGTYRLAWIWFREPWAAAAVALVYGLNGAVIISTALGYVLAMSYCSLPWLALLRLPDRLAVFRRNLVGVLARVRRDERRSVPECLRRRPDRYYLGALRSWSSRPTGERPCCSTQWLPSVSLFSCVVGD